MARTRGLRVGLITLAVLALLAVMRPWTIEPIPKSPAATFDAVSFVGSSWARVLAEAQERARDAATMVKGSEADASGAPSTGERPGRRAQFVKGTGLVTDVDLQSRVGRALVQLEGTVPPVTVAIQVGPVLRGTALRDALSFVSFSDVPNQFDFAAVANALNDRVLATVLSSLDARTLSGQRVSFAGASSPGDPAGHATLEIVPVTLSVAGRGVR